MLLTESVLLFQRFTDYSYRELAQLVQQILPCLLQAKAMIGESGIKAEYFVNLQKSIHKPPAMQPKDVFFARECANTIADLERLVRESVPDLFRRKEPKYLLHFMVYEHEQFDLKIGLEFFDEQVRFNVRYCEVREGNLEEKAQFKKQAATLLQIFNDAFPEPKL
jgi:hypothetical protein